MSRREREPVGENFAEQLEALRMRIDSLPQSQRPHLYALADTIAQQLPPTKQHELPHDTNA